MAYTRTKEQFNIGVISTDEKRAGLTDKDLFLRAAAEMHSSPFSEPKSYYRVDASACSITSPTGTTTAIPKFCDIGLTADVSRSAIKEPLKHMKYVFIITNFTDLDITRLEKAVPLIYRSGIPFEILVVEQEKPLEPHAMEALQPTINRAVALALKYSTTITQIKLSTSAIEEHLKAIMPNLLEKSRTPASPVRAELTSFINMGENPFSPKGGAKLTSPKLSRGKPHNKSTNPDSPTSAVFSPTSTHRSITSPGRDSGLPTYYANPTTPTSIHGGKKELPSPPIYKNPMRSAHTTHLSPKKLPDPTGAVARKTKEILSPTWATRGAGQLLSPTGPKVELKSMRPKEATTFHAPGDTKVFGSVIPSKGR